MDRKLQKAKETIASMAKAGAEKLDVDGIREKTAQAAELIGEKAVVIKGAAAEVKEDIEAKLFELDNLLKESVTEYNNAYTLMNDKGVRLFVERCRCVDAITFAESIVNSIANRPKTFDTDFEEIRTNRARFTEACEFADQELYAARVAAGGAGAGIAAGATVAFMAPTAAMWIATTFGTASTGTAISALSGAAATNAALAWLGGGALTAGGGGIVGGQALLALAGPIGWSIAGATLLTTILLFTARKAKLNKQKNEEIVAVKQNTHRVMEMDAQIAAILEETVAVKTGLASLTQACMALFGADYSALSEEEKQRLGVLVNTTRTASALLDKMVQQEESEPCPNN